MVSVCLASYNGEKYIREQILSILPQLTSKDELLISDDGSTDTTVSIVNGINHPSIKLFHNRFRNHVKNFEFLLTKAKGDFIFLADQDDIWMPNKLSTMKCFLEKYDLVLSDCILVDADKNVIRNSVFLNKPKTGFIRNFYKNIYTGCCIGFNRKVLINSLPFPNHINSHDMWIGLVANLVGKVIVIPEPLIYFRRHGKNFSSNSGVDTYLSGKSPYSIVTIVKLRFRLLLSLIKVFLNKKD